jgi:tetratricopeptide (TPR) repeat protein
MIFISYRISDSLDLVGHLEADLVREFGNDAVFRDKSRLRGGHDWTQELEHHASSCQVMLVVIGATWQTVVDESADLKGMLRLLNPKDWVRREITLALDAGNAVIPIFLNDAEMPSEGWLAVCQLDRLYRKQGEKIRSLEYANDLAKLITRLRQLGLRSKISDGTAPPKPRLPTPPELYAAPNYILTSTFIGRASELDELDAWATSTDPMLVVEGIGGLGKSALTWEWMLKRAQYAIPNLAGRVWWSFYERGASMSAFVRHALAYITGQDPEALTKETSHYQRSQELLTELKRRPFLLVLDGFERVLTAYHRWDKAQQRDDKIEADLRECTDPHDGDLLRQLLHGSPSKIILSTRLFPHILEDRASHKPILGVAHHELKGLSRSDALAFFKNAGIQGNEKAMLEFADQFGRHSLLLKVVCGEIANYPRQPSNFDTWRADMNYGGKLKLSELDLKQNYNHILHFALDGLEESKRRLLCRIAVLSENVRYDTIAVLNPFLPPKPEVVKEPDDPQENSRWQRLSEEERAQRLARYRKSLDAFNQYKEALASYPQSTEYRQTIHAFDKALKELQDRGLLQWDRDNGYYDMHPVVRGHAADFLEDGDRKQTFLKVRDHIAALPPDDFNKATELAHLTHSLEIYRCLIGAGHFDEAVSFWKGGLSDTLFFNLGAYTLGAELLLSLFRGSKDGLPCLISLADQSYILNDLGFAFFELGRVEEASSLLGAAFRIDLREQDWNGLGTGLRNYSIFARRLDRRAEGAGVLALGRSLAEIADHQVGISCAILLQAWEAIDEGRFTDANHLLTEFVARPQPPLSAYRPGDVQLTSCRSQFFEGRMTEAAWRRGHDLAVEHRNVKSEHRFEALRGEWMLAREQPAIALEAVEKSLKIINRLGTPIPDYHDLRARALAELGRDVDARAELAQGIQRRFAAEAWLALGDRDQARACALNAFRHAWGEGPPHILCYELERSRAILKQLGEPEPQLPAFDPSKVRPIPYEKEIRAAIEKLKAEKAAKTEPDGES